MKMVFECRKCMECPCLRNDQYGFICFFADTCKVIELWQVDEIQEWCPIMEHED